MFGLSISRLKDLSPDLYLRVNPIREAHVRVTRVYIVTDLELEAILGPAELLQPRVDVLHQHIALLHGVCSHTHTASTDVFIEFVLTTSLAPIK